MSHANRLRTEYWFLLAAFEQGAASQTTAEERQKLAILFARESVKGALRLKALDIGGRRKEAIEHLRREFADTDDLKVVIDYKPQILDSARQFADSPNPLEAVILYAVWAEHWLNGMLLLAALASGMSETDATSMLKDSRVPAKLGWLWTSLKLPALDPIHRSRLELLFQVRNEYLHYKWAGKDPESIYPAESRLIQAIAGIEATVQYAHEMELSVIAPHVAVGEAIFEATDTMARLRRAYFPIQASS